VQNRNGKSMGSYSLKRDATVNALKDMFYEKNKKYYPERQWFTVGEEPKKVVLKSGSKLSEYQLKDEDVITFKDLGAQIGWRTVFLIEYFGPILLHTLCYAFPSLVYGEEIKEHNYIQTLGFGLAIFHYAKREFETLFIHRFSNGTMPFFNVFKNSFHYWILGGLNIAYFLYHPKYTVVVSESTANICAVVFLIAELGNLHCHIILRNLRSEGTGERGIPSGNLFAIVSCGNYTWELAAWAAFCVFTQTLTGYIFLLVSTVQIAIWAKKKHQQYKREFGEKYTKLRRNILFPFIW